MDTKQIRMLQLLDSQILECKNCSLWEGGRCKPYWEETARYVIVGEAPGKQEVEKGIPFYEEAPAGSNLWKTMESFELYRKDFLIINSTNCRPTNGEKNLKPNIHQITECRKWLEKYIKVVAPKKMLLLGNYALSTILTEGGIMSLNGLGSCNKEFNCNVMRSVHPATCIYLGEKGKKMLHQAIGNFREMEG